MTDAFVCSHYVERHEIKESLFSLNGVNDRFNAKKNMKEREEARRRR